MVWTCKGSYGACMKKTGIQDAGVELRQNEKKMMKEDTCGEEKTGFGRAQKKAKDDGEMAYYWDV